MTTTDDDGSTMAAEATTEGARTSTAGAAKRAAGSAAPVSAAGSMEAVPSYEKARDELAEVVRALETGGVTLEESLQLWERGEQLARICQDWLDGARARLQAAVESEPS